jgi:hypothetical protein
MYQRAKDCRDRLASRSEDLKLRTVEVEEDFAGQRGDR